MTKYTDIEIMFFRAVAWSLKLAAPPEFFDWPIDTLQGICNGVGGEGSALTPALTWAYRNYQATAAIHDLRYHLGGSEADRERADREFLSTPAASGATSGDGSDLSARQLCASAGRSRWPIMRSEPAEKNTGLSAARWLDADPTRCILSSFWFRAGTLGGGEQARTGKISMALLLSLFSPWMTATGPDDRL